ncbi:bifunctional glycosyltransferase/CDP-glycerol:glycerophosphate glycerophosphotransferase [Actinomadura scrupuli]|uniref:bifunctional glycosyltransferase/CDP-glycerol:glycerophosphate glycerophosphotransferase n=1 Tax=Actinomadura scrupuli TaxID=559629 RepID=UPI003D980006
MVTTARISVVVLTHGAGSSLQSCLASIADQSRPDVEVLLVDDGTGTVAEEDGFRLVRAGAPSRGAARNLGAAAATGDYLMFLDGDDVLIPGALDALAGALDAGDADFAIGNVRLPADVTRRSRESAEPERREVRARRELFSRPRPDAHITRDEALLHDRQVSSRLFRRSFWKDRRLEFPDGDCHEDLTVAVQAHFLASSVHVIPDRVVRRRAALPELTSAAKDVADGFAAVEAVLTRLEGHWRAKDRRRFLETVLERELRVFIDALPDADDEERTAILEQAAAFAGGLDPKVFDRLPALTRLKWHLAQRRLKTELVKLVRYERGKITPTIVRNPLRRYVVYPYWKDDKLAIPERLYRARDEVSLRTRVHEVTWEDGKLRVSGEAYINSVNARRKWTSVKAITLRRGKRRIPLLATQTHKPGKTSGAWSGFTFTIDPKRLRRRGRWIDGGWKVHAAVFNSGVYRKAALRGGVSGSGANPPYHYVSDDVRIVPRIKGGEFRVRVETVRALATSLEWSGDTLTVSGTAREKAPSALRLSRGDRVVPVPVSVSGRDFTASVQLGELANDAGVLECGRGTDDTSHWCVSAVISGESVPLVLAEAVADARQLSGTQEAIAERGSGGYLRLSVRTARLVVTGCTWRNDGTLVVTGAHPVFESGEILLRSQGRRQEYVYGLVPSGTEMRAEIPVTSVPTLAGVLPLRQGKWDVLYRPTGPDRHRAFAVSMAPEVTAGLPVSIEKALRSYTLQNQQGQLVLAVGSDLRPEEVGAATRLREEARRLVAKSGLRDAVLFSCFSGRQYSDSPRAVHEELMRRGNGLEQLWVVNDAQVELPDSLKAVRLNSKEWHEAIATSRYIVANHRLGDWFQRHPDQVVLQTWHGTPLKKLGSDVKEVHFAYAPGMKKALQSAKSDPKAPALPEWNYLVSPNAFSTEIFRRAFKFKGDIIEAGYPRNDVMYSPEADSIAASVRARVGVPAGKKVVMYAPTWRDDQFYGRGRYKADWRIDLDHFAEVLGDDHVLLVRLHPNVVDGAPAHPLVYDVSAYPDISELYLITDVMVSDYSSVMFDFANTGRPMLFFTYDLAHYRDKLRGFYFDFEAEAPGPLLESSADLIEALRSVDSISESYGKAYAAFAERFCALEDGKAAARVVDRVFPG